MTDLLTRRRALASLGGFGLSALLAACSRERSTAPATTSAAGSTAVECVLSPELTEGPYYLDLDNVRSDIAEGRPGTPLALRVNVVDAGACTPLKDAAVDVWHCDAAGAYSGVEGATSETFCRGVQMTAADGAAEFATIVPGWYPGRAVHIHVKVQLGGSDTFTGQLFFDDATLAAAYEAEPYASRGEPDTPNAADGIYGQSEGRTTLALSPAGDGYEGVVTLGVLRA